MDEDEDVQPSVAESPEHLQAGVCDEATHLIILICGRAAENKAHETLPCPEVDTHIVSEADITASPLIYKTLHTVTLKYLGRAEEKILNVGTQGASSGRKHDRRDADIDSSCCSSFLELIMKRERDSQLVVLTADASARTSVSVCVTEGLCFHFVSEVMHVGDVVCCERRQIG